ncbi:uracil-DNA glycosylase [Thermodesulfobacterium hveragerdense]|uniref:uracil-DNA glycosylase n=1 Tax=Thermodesulfobacterium hveragerdense TaxID=53424 RepID=UPI000418DED3|nr:uracil-DNA glycosylase [Thermodesulfobacterium hveragerdense]
MDVKAEIIKNLLYLKEIGLTSIPASEVIKRLLQREISLEEDSLLALKEKVIHCENCSLHRVRKAVVWGDGPTEPGGLMIISEYPDRDEDFYGKPFVKEVGNLLDRMLNAINLKRELFFITHTVKCKPPGGRPPEPEEIEACRPYLLKQIKYLRPKLILALGFTPPKVLLERKTLTLVRGKVFTLKETSLFFTYHPGYILKNPGIKRVVWEDLQRFRKLYEKIFLSS